MGISLSANSTGQEDRSSRHQCGGGPVSEGAQLPVRHSLRPNHGGRATYRRKLISCSHDRVVRNELISGRLVYPSSALALPLAYQPPSRTASTR